MPGSSEHMSLAVGQPERETHTLREACARLGIGKTLGYELARVGRFPVPVIRVGRRLVVSRAAIDRLLAGEVEQPR